MPFDTLVEMALEYGLVLEMKSNFHQYYERKKTESSFLFQKMVMNNEGVRSLTQDQIEQQWEVIGLYCVFAFRKDSGKAAQELLERSGNTETITKL